MRRADLVRTQRRLAGTAAVGGVLSLLVALGTAVQPAVAVDPEATPTASPTGAPTPTTTPTEATVAPSPTTGAPTATPDAGDEIEVEDAVFAWSMSEQTNALSHNPGAINFLSAGVANPGRGGATMRERDWKATAGKVSVQKRRADGRWSTATWAGLRTDATGAPIGIYGPFSGHRVRITGGTGVVDPVAEEADVRWSGTWTVVYYAGNTVFTLTDPRIEVRGGRGTLTALAGGWGSDRNDPTAWDPVPSRRVTVVDLPGVDVTEKGFVVTPDYAGVRVDGTVPQRRTGEGWGSFHPELVSFLAPMGTDQFWYSTGLQSDWTKLPTPVSASWAGAAPVTPQEPTPTSRVLPKPTNEVVTRPAPRATPSVTPPAEVPAPVATVPVPSDVPLAATPVQGRQRAGTLAAPVQVTSASAAPEAAAGRVAPWTAGGLLLIGAALLLVLPVGRRSPS